MRFIPVAPTHLRVIFYVHTWHPVMPYNITLAKYETHWEELYNKYIEKYLELVTYLQET